MSGFATPPAFTVLTTYVVADGQCGEASPDGCDGVRTSGSGDELDFQGGAGVVSDGLDAVKGSDGCPWGTDTCLWDTRSFDVSLVVAPGDIALGARPPTVRASSPPRGA
jgi:hypothetical protein